MRADYLTYRSATGVSLKGLVLQLTIAVAMIIYAALARDHAAMTAAAFLGIGSLSWLSLTILYDQHRRERIEAMEVDALAATAGSGASVFEAQEQFRPAARRLAALYKYFVPVMSLIIGALLVGIGLWRLSTAQSRLAPDEFSAPTKAGWAIGLGLVTAGVCFIFARYSAMMAKQPIWANLRAGASFIMGGSVLGFAIVVAHFVDNIGPNFLVRYLQAAFPIIMVVVGIEVFLNFVLGIYRPRKAGETPRVAFESRLMGFLATPDRIAQSISDAVNYQLGFNVTSGWFYQLLSRWLLPLTIFGLLIIWGLSAFVVVQPHQRAMILRFGHVVRNDVPPGPHFKLPWPIETVYVPEYMVRDTKGKLRVVDRTATGLRTLDLGTAPPGTPEPILWTNEHAGAEVYQFVRASAVPTSQNGEANGAKADFADLAMVSVEIPMQYAVNNVQLFDELTVPERRDDLLRATAQRQITLYMQQLTLDDVLGGKRTDISAELRKRVQQAFDNLNPGPDGKPRGAGVEVVYLGISGVHPPKEAATAFETPVQADQRREAAIESARADAIEALTKVVGDVALARSIIRELDALDNLGVRADSNAIKDQEFKIQQLLDKAGGGASSMLAEARATRWQLHMGSRGRAARYKGQLALYSAAPELYRSTQYFEALKTAMRSSRVYITSDEISESRIDVDLKEKDMGVDLFSKPNE